MVAVARIASATPVTTAGMRRAKSVRVASLKVRTVPDSVAVSGTTLSASPAWSEPTVITARSRGSVSRETSVWSTLMIRAPTTTGSTVRCG